jgi:RNA polymerase sigma factor (sigma-70 family)
MVGQSDPRLVDAARAGDPRALDELVAQSLPLVYSLVGRALGRRAEVDDVVQDTMLSVVGGIGGLRDPQRFRSWLVAVTMNQIRDHHRYRRQVPQAAPPDPDRPDPGADFVDETLTRMGLSGQRREIAGAARWLDPEDRDLLSLWWLEAAGELSRAQLATALDLDPHHATVRVGRMKDRLDTARLVVRALTSRPRCPELSDLASPWPGEPTPLWRKRFIRHIRECRGCPAAPGDLIPAERLIGVPELLPIPAGYIGYVLAGLHHAGIATTAPTMSAQSFPGPADGRDAGPGHESGTGHGPASGSGHRRPSGHRRDGGHTVGRFGPRPMVFGVAVVAAAAGIGLTAVALTDTQPPTNPAAGAGLTGSAPVSPTGAVPASPLGQASPASPSGSATATTGRPSPSTSAKSAHPTHTTAAPTPRQTTASDASAVQQVLDLINQAREQQGLAPYTITSGLTTSSTRHNGTMADGCGLSHQCPGEAALGARETAAGVQWSSAGENIGEAGGVSDSQAAIANAAVGLTQDMLDEQPPDDGHRLNILSSSFHHIGIAVFIDGSGTVWMTQDFSN